MGHRSQNKAGTQSWSGSASNASGQLCSVVSTVLCTPLLQQNPRSNPGQHVHNVETCNPHVANEHLLWKSLTFTENPPDHLPTLWHRYTEQFFANMVTWTLWPIVLILMNLWVIQCHTNIIYKPYNIRVLLRISGALLRLRKWVRQVGQSQATNFWALVQPRRTSKSKSRNRYELRSKYVTWLLLLVI